MAKVKIEDIHLYDDFDVRDKDDERFPTVSIKLLLIQLIKENLTVYQRKSLYYR